MVIASTACPHPIVRPAEVERALRARRHRPILLIDIAVPRNVDPACHALDGAYVYDVDALAGVASANADERRRDAARAAELLLLAAGIGTLLGLAFLFGVTRVRAGEAAGLARRRGGAALPRRRRQVVHSRPISCSERSDRSGRGSASAELARTCHRGPARDESAIAGPRLALWCGAPNSSPGPSPSMVPDTRREPAT